MKEALNFGWHFKKGYQEDYLLKPLKDYEEVDLPHTVKEVPLNDFSEEDYQGLFTYEKFFDAPLTEEHHYFLRFDGFMLEADIYLNGSLLGHYLSGWYPVTINVTAYLKKKNNRLLVVLDTREDKNIPPFGKVVDYLTFGGIYRPVSLLDKPKAYIESLQILKASSKELLLSCPIKGSESLKPTFTLYDKDGNTVFSTADTKISLENIHVWDIDDPYLYTLKAALEGEEETDEITLRVGFRDFSFQKDGFYLNGRKLKLIGLNRHQNYPYVGPAMPKSSQREDAEILKYELGCNIVRTSHYSQSEEFLSRCDEIGLLVQSEVPGWQFVSKEKAWRDNMLDFTKRMVLKEENHPSLIAYGTRVDESPDDDELYQKTNDIVHQYDKEKYTTGVRNFKTSHCLEDFYCYNDFSCGDLSHGLDDIKSVKGAEGKAVLISENNGHMFPTKMYDHPMRRVEHALRHLKVMDDAYKYNYAGEIGWCAFDYNTHKDFGSDDHICYHGVADIFRNPKAAGFAFLSEHCAKPLMEVFNLPLSGDNDEATMKPLYCFTNLDSVKFYRNDEYIGEFFPDRKLFPHLPYPPIVIDDFIGERFSEGLSAKDSRTIVRGLNEVARIGITHVKKEKFTDVLRVMLLHHISFDQLNSWYNKYLSPWGEKVTEYTLVGIKDGKEVMKKTLGPSTEFHFDLKVQKKELVNEDTYDVSRVSITLRDQYGFQQYYAFKPIVLRTEGPIQVLGPKVITTYGGDVSVYVRSLWSNKPSEAILYLETELGEEKVEFTVRSEE